LDRLLVIGSTGLVGSKLVFMASSHGFEPYNTQNRRRSHFPNSSQLDITDRDATLALVRDVQPKVIVNTAALTNVDYCETHKEEAENVNVRGVENLAEAARRNNSRLVHISTDSVFDGTYGHYSEFDKPNPINQYAMTKLASEKVVSHLSNYAIARPSVIYGWHSQPAEATTDSTKAMNFAMFVLDKLKKNETVKAVRDQYSSPTFADNLAEVLLKLAKSRENGIFHTAGRSCLSRYEFASKLTKVFGYSSRLLQPVFTGEFQQIAKRPKNCCLQVDKAEKILGMRFLTSEEGIKEVKKQQSFGFDSQVQP
jgi:dTDP-4-dehydrorhamnose reductase